MTDRPTVYDTAPALYEEHQELVRTMAQLPLRERLVRRAALADRETLGTPEADGKVVQSVLSAAFKLAAHDQAHGTAAGPVAPQSLGPSSPGAVLRGYIRQEYGAWSSPAERHPAVWLVTRGEDPGAVAAEDEATGRAYAEARYREDEDPDEPAALRWDDDGQLLDETLDPSYPYAGWTVREERVLRSTDLPSAQ